jgi:small GTP-binding protein
MARHIPGSRSLILSEEQVIQHLVAHLPDDFTIFTNVITNNDKRNIEIDAIVLGRYALYVIEIKHLSGKMRGNSQTWQLGDEHKDQHILPNPLIAARKRALILRSQLKAAKPELGKIAVEYLVCLAGNKPDLEILDVDENRRRIVWYRDIVKILTNSNFFNYPRQVYNAKRDISHFHAEIENVILKNYVPPEIIEKAKIQKELLDTYLVTPERANQPLHESKLLVVGQGSVGKSSLVERIVRNTFTHKIAKTEGIDIHTWQVKGHEIREFDPQITDPETATNNGFMIRLNIWDFGGQEIMRATHQFFLTRRSLYLLVIDNRNSQDQNQAEYWLKIIGSFSEQSPVLIVGNKSDQHPLDIDRTGLRKKYPNIVGILETSAVTGAGIDELRNAITEQVNNLPHIHDLLSDAWSNIKKQLEEYRGKTNYINYDDYIKLCTQNGVTDEISQRALISFLHDLGVVLYFQDNPRLEALGILNPQWVTNGVYKILNSDAVFQNKGMLTVSMVNEILNLPEYPRNKRLFIVDMMKKFELCYDIEADKTFLVPNLLPKDEPAKLKFNGIPAFEYAYPVLPSSVITRLIVRMNQHVLDNYVWRTGVLLKIGENTALVKADIEDYKITIAIDGLEHTRRETLAAIFYHLDDIPASIKGLNPERLVPVPGAENAKPIPYNYLLMLEAKGMETLPVPDGNRLIDVNIRKILSGIPNETQNKEDKGNVTNNIIIGGNFDGNLILGDNNQSIKDSYNKITSAKIDAELKKNLSLLADAVAVMIKSLPAEQATEATDDLSTLVEEATKPAPQKKWYSVSIDGLIKAAENVEKVGEPVINLSRKVLSLLTGGVLK